MGEYVGSMGSKVAGTTPATKAMVNACDEPSNPEPRNDALQKSLIRIRVLAGADTGRVTEAE
ncbi:MAG: hypothetical protein JNM84_01235 [Planctomycetes bacterium]|jgi:hypothetical protein|nr:hypothetical protein [Planctomycetota bacterium]